MEYNNTPEHNAHLEQAVQEFQELKRTDKKPQAAYKRAVITWKERGISTKDVVGGLLQQKCKKMSPYLKKYSNKLTVKDCLKPNNSSSITEPNVIGIPMADHMIQITKLAMKNIGFYENVVLNFNEAFSINKSAIFWDFFYHDNHYRDDNPLFFYYNISKETWYFLGALVAMQHECTHGFFEDPEIFSSEEYFNPQKEYFKISRFLEWRADLYYFTKNLTNFSDIIQDTKEKIMVALGAEMMYRFRVLENKNSIVKKTETDTHPLDKNRYLTLHCIRKLLEAEYLMLLLKQPKSTDGSPSFTLPALDLRSFVDLHFFHEDLRNLKIDESEAQVRIKKNMDMIIKETKPELYPGNAKRAIEIILKYRTMQIQLDLISFPVFSAWRNEMIKCIKELDQEEVE